MPRRRRAQKNISEEEEDGELLVQEGDKYGEDGGNRRRRQNLKRRRRDDYYDDEEEEEEDEEEDDDDEGRGSHHKRKRRPVSALIDDMAVVADSSEEDEEDDAEEGFIDDNPTDLAKEGDHGRMPRRSFLPTEDFDQDDIDDAEAITRRIAERYGSSSQADQYDEGEKITYVEQQSLLPSVRDPKLWLVKCEIGHEREVVICLMQKATERPELQITSAVALDNLKNYIYIEAQKEAHVIEACKGLRYVNPKKMMIVPIKEMAGVLSVKGKSIDICKDTWIRMKTGAYKGDLGQVIDVDDIRERVTVKLVPRIDLQELADKLAGLEVAKKTFVPPPRLINIREAREKNIHVDRKHDPYTGEYFEKISGMMFKDGFLYKSVSMKSIRHRDIQPSFDELVRFQQPGDTADGDFSSSLSLGDTKKEHFLKGDKVVVVKGDLKNMRGIVEKVEDECVCIRPEIKGLPETLSVSVKDIGKYFETGDHVKVTSGLHEGATGMVIKVEGRVLVIVSDASMEEIRVFTDSVVKSSEVTSTANLNNDYQIHDLVLLNDSSFGLIIRLDGKAIHVLKGTPGRSEIEVLTSQDITSKIEKLGIAEDKLGNRISVKDALRIAEGPFKGKQGTVERVYKQTVFIHDRNTLEQGGFVCVKAQSCTLLGGSYARREAKGGQMVSQISRFRSSAGNSQSPGRPLIRGDERRYQSARRGHDSIIGTTVKICKGHYKGSRGRVIEVKGQSIRIELESQMRTVTVDRSQISDRVNVTTPSCNTPRYGLGSERPMHDAMRTPMHDGMRTPMHDGMRTPMHDGMRTPMHDGMRTPMRSWAWNPYASMTPARDAYSPASQLERAASPGSGWGHGSRNCIAPGTPRESSISHGNTANIIRSPQLLIGTP